MSAVVGRQVLTSTNAGANWRTSSLPAIEWTSVACSADGRELAAVSSSGPLCISTNSGLLWTTSSVPHEIWSSVAMSADGQTLAAVASLDNPPIFVSTNQGLTWLSNSVSGMPGGTIACSADGSRLMMLTTGFFYSSTNSGVTWTFKTHVGAANRNSPIAASADGRKLAVAFSSDGIYTSTNFGGTWTSNNVPPSGWASIASSADGTKLTAVAGGPFNRGPVYTSRDSGFTWSSNSVALQSWTSVASSADGGRLVAATESTGIWSAQLLAMPQVNIIPAETNLLVSWLVPSTPLVLQQNADLTSGIWTRVDDSLTLNSHNLHYEISVSPTNRQSFYRLATPGP